MPVGLMSVASLGLQNVVFVGDSITLGVGATNPFPANIATIDGITASNQALNGAGWQRDFGQGSLTAVAAASVDPLLSSLTRSRLPPKLVLFAGTNDIVSNPSTGAQTYALFQTYLAARIAAGWVMSNIVVATMLPRTNATEAERVAYNAALVSGASAGYVLARNDLDPNMGGSGKWSDTTYFQADGIHPNNTGLQVLANIIAQALKFSPVPAY